VYAEISDSSELVTVVEEYLSEYNSETTQPMQLVMFLDAIQHITRITRVLRQPQV
jgi:dynein heavy chain